MADQYTDTLSLDSPAGQRELTVLQSMKVGDIRKGDFIPALSMPLEWRCNHVGPSQKFWVLEGTFFGVPVIKAEIMQTDTALILVTRGLVV